MGLLKYTALVRAFGQFFWNSLDEQRKTYWNQTIKASGEVLKAFPESKEYEVVLEALSQEIATSVFYDSIFKHYSADAQTLEFETASYLFYELQQ